MECLFCRIIEGEIPCDKVYEDKEILAFKDINPQAPTHILIIPKKHIPRISDIAEKDSSLIASLFKVGNELAAEADITDSGYRLVINCNSDAGQTVFHIHLHLLGGRPFMWPPG